MGIMNEKVRNAVESFMPLGSLGQQWRTLMNCRILPMTWQFHSQINTQKKSVRPPTKKFKNQNFLTKHQKLQKSSKNRSNVFKGGVCSQECYVVRKNGLHTAQAWNAWTLCLLNQPGTLRAGKVVHNVRERSSHLQGHIDSKEEKVAFWGSGNAQHLGRTWAR